MQTATIPINFAQGLDTKTDPKQVQIGKFLSLENMIFEEGMLLKKRNGYQELTALPSSMYSHVTTFNGNLTAIGQTIAAYSAGTKTWVPQGSVQPVSLSTLPLIRNNLNQTQCDTAISANGLACTVYTETNGSSNDYKYVIADSTTGQNIVEPTLIPAASGGTITGSPKVFVYAGYFILIFTNEISATYHLQFIAISYSNPSLVIAATDIATSYIPASTVAWDGVVTGTGLYVAYNTTSGGQSVKVSYINAALNVVTPTIFSGVTATVMSLCADNTIPQSPIIYISTYNVSGSGSCVFMVVDKNLNTVLGPFPFQMTSHTVVNLASAAQNGSATIFAEVQHAYGYDSSIPSNYIVKTVLTPAPIPFKSVFSSGATTLTVSSTVGLQGGMYLTDNTTAAHITSGTLIDTVGATTITISIATAGNSASSPGDTLGAAGFTAPLSVGRSVGLASKAFIINGTIYVLGAYESPYQNTYFLFNGTESSQTAPIVVAKLAYENGGGYCPTGLPSVSVIGSKASIAYLYKDLIEALSTVGNPEQTTTGGIYSQTGINLATFDFTPGALDTAEIGSNLNIPGGFLRNYDGYLPVENGFFLWPDSVEVTTATTGGSITAQTYYYQFTYEWSDNQGNIYRSAPSIPVSIVVPSGTSTNANTLYVPTLRLTYKTANPVKIVGYRWSTANQEYYQFTSIAAPILNNVTADYVTITDTLADSSIIGNNLIYTTGGVVEDINGPASNITTLFDDRLWLVDAEDPNLMWFSKQIIEATPVEMSDLFTYYVAPTQGAQGSTGPITALSPMDSELVVFKANAIYYITGTGPDNTGANNQYSQPLFVTSTVGCSNPSSIVFIPNGLMFQSDQGIWLLDRNLQVSYIGAPVEAFNNATVTSAVNIPGTTRVEFTLDTGVTLVYDYYYDQWATFTGTNIEAISSCIYNGLKTFITPLGEVFQEAPGIYLDGSSPVLMSFITGNIQLQGISGFQRLIEIQLLGQYYSPHLLNVQLGYDFGALSEQAIISPTNFTGVYGSDSIYGMTSPNGGPSQLEQWRVQNSTQRCQAFQISLQEIFDPSFGTVAGEGFSLSAMTCTIGVIKSYRPVKAAQTVGTT